MLRKESILVSLLFFLCFQLTGQRFFFHTDSVRTDPNFVSTTIFYGFMDIEDCSATIVEWARGNGLFQTDIAILSQGDVYSYMSFGISFTLISERTYFQRGFFEDTNNITALSCNNAGLIYGAGTGLSSYNPINQEITYLGDLPIEMQAAGDLTFREGKLYLSTISNTLVEVDVNNPMNSQVFMTFPPGTPPIHAMATIHSGCEVVTYAIGTHDTGSIIYEIDFDNKTLIELCRTDFRIMGAASEDECVITVCNVLVDLDANNSSGLNNHDFQADTTCTFPILIADNDVKINAVEYIDSITLILSGIQDVNQEYLEAISSLNVTVMGRGTALLTLYNNGGASPADFAAIIQQIAYHNDAANPTPGTREVWVRAFTPNFSSEVATSYLYISSRPVLSKTITSVSCHDFNDGNIVLSANSGMMPYSFQWSDGDTNATRNNIPAGTYTVTVTDRNGCAASDTIQLINPEQFTLSVQADADTICNQSGALTVIPVGGVPPYSYDWRPIEETTQRVENLAASSYSVWVTDSRHCSVGTTYTLFQREIVSTQDKIAICKEETYNFNGILLTQDTTICQTFTASNGCDSMHCLTLQVLDRTSRIEASICEGRTYVFGNRTLTNAGVYTDTIRDGDLCDSLVILTLQFMPPPDLSITAEGSLCEGGVVKLSAGSGFSNYRWSNGAFSSSIDANLAGRYGVTVTNSDGCVVSDSIEIDDVQLSATVTIDNPSCFGNKDGDILIDTVTGGTAPFFYSINGQTMQASNRFERLGGGTYEIKVEDVNGCFYETTVTLQEPEVLVLDLGEDITLALGDSATLQAITNALNPQIKWTPPTGLSCDTCLITIAHPSISTNYEVSITDQNGCIAKDGISILVNNRDGIFTPSAFSPNGDGINDRFTVFTNNSVAKINYFRVFDRWGNLLYEAKDFIPNKNNAAWDGTFQGQAMPTGTYVYSIAFETADGRIQFSQGEVLLVR